MAEKWMRPAAGAVSVKDEFWTPYLENVRKSTVPHVFKKFEETGYLANYADLANGRDAEHYGPNWANGLVLESIRGVCDFLAAAYDAELEAVIDPIIDDIVTVGEKYDDLPLTANIRGGRKPWGKDGHIVYTHDLYNVGTLMEAAVSHYLATKKTKLLITAIRAANRIADEIGDAPKYNAVPGHSLPEEAMLRLYRLLRDHRELDDLAASLGADKEEYLRVVRHWYDRRGCYEGRTMCPPFSTQYNQDHAPFAEQDEAVGHAVRATLCYTGAASLAYEEQNGKYDRALHAIWESITKRKMHVSGGIGTRHDIEGFDIDYNLPNGAYLETCASVGLIFFAGEMGLMEPRGDYYDVFERALYNTVLASMDADGVRYFYQNPLISDGSIRRWDWHGCPCCPPMLLKLFSSLSQYIYTYRADALCIHLLLDSAYENEYFSVLQSGRCISVDSRGSELTLRLRIPEYAEQYTLTLNGCDIPYETDDHYAVIRRIWSADDVLTVSFDTPPRRVCANPAVEADRGRVCVMVGPYVMCAEAMDNGGDVNFMIAADPNLHMDGDRVIGRRTDGRDFVLIPYYQWCRRDAECQALRAMNVWFRQEDMKPIGEIGRQMADKLYDDYL